MVCDCPGASGVSRHWSVPRCHSMISTGPDTAVTSHPLAHAPMYGYSGVPSVLNTERDWSAARALLWYAAQSGHVITAPVHGSPEHSGMLQTQSAWIAWITPPPGPGGSPGAASFTR